MALALRGARARPRSSAPDNQERPTREDRIRQEVHVLRVVRVQVSLNNISQKRTRARKGEETQSQGTEAPSTSEGDVKMPTKDQAVTESRNRKDRRNVRIHMCTHANIHIHRYTSIKNTANLRLMKLDSRKVSNAHRRSSCFN